MAIREIVHIDEEKCNGCGLCVPNCAEGALKIIDGKARLVSEKYCDGLGACLGTCPQDAIRVIKREADEFDEDAVAVLMKNEDAPVSQAPAHGGGCPGLAIVNEFIEDAPEGADNAELDDAAQPSALRQWPVQLNLVPVDAPYLDGADLLLAADCVPFAMANFHGAMLKGRRLLVGCPKLDDAGQYAEKLGEMLRVNDIRSLTIVHMEVPCCGGLVALADRALAACGKDIPVEDVTVSLQGKVMARKKRPVDAKVAGRN